MAGFDFDELLTDLTPELHQALGAETFTLRRPSTLEAVKGGKTPKLLELAAAAEASAETISVRLPGAAGLMKGAVLEASTLTIAGEEYSVTVDAAIPAPSSSTLSISISPALTGELDEGEPVEITSGPVYQLVDVLLVSAGRREQTGNLAGAEVIMEISVPVKTAPTTPRNGDGILRAKGGTTGQIIGTPIIVGGSWEIKVGAPS